MCIALKSDWARVLSVLLLIAAAGAGKAETSAERFETQFSEEISLQYFLTLPEGYGAAAEREGGDAERQETGEGWPLVIFLHGSGERGDDLDKVRKWGPLRQIDRGQAPDALLNAIIVTPQCPNRSWWAGDNMLKALDGLLDETVSQYDVDKSRIYLTGLSMGGYGTWAWAGSRRDTFAAIVPICGGGSRWHGESVGRAKLPVWCFHGDNDPAVPLAESVAMMQQVWDAGHRGTDARLTVYPNTAHNSWAATYSDPAMWEWLFSHRRVDKAEAQKSEEREKAEETE